MDSGLEETMITAFHDIRKAGQRTGKNVDLRSAAYVDAIDKIAVSYNEMGILP